MMGGKEISILIVDDERMVRELVSMCFETQYSCTTAASAEEATELLESKAFNLVLTDIRMPGATGLDLCNLIKKMYPQTVVVLMSGMTDIQYAIGAMRHGAFDYIVKPFNVELVTLTVNRALQHQELIEARSSYKQSLENLVLVRTDQLRSLNDNLNTTLETLYTNYRAALATLARSLETNKLEPRGHSDRVVAYCLRLGKEVGLPTEDLIALEQGALLHDVGNTCVSNSIFLKRGSLTEDERIQMREHVKYGLLLIEGMDFLTGARPVVSQHHEKYDGTGYPAGLVGEMIHVNARIFAVADAFDAMTSDRPYRNALPYGLARAEIIGGSGSHFDPMMVKAFLNIPEAEWAEIQRLAESQGHVTHLIDKRELRSFILSIKHRTSTTGPLSMSCASPLSQ
jgi:response regulator RpfG family c-di-GMP phosphodiesterase